MQGDGGAECGGDEARGARILRSTTSGRRGARVSAPFILWEHNDDRRIRDRWSGTIGSDHTAHIYLSLVFFFFFFFFLFKALL